MTTPQLILASLKHDRQFGLTFEEAWVKALRRIPRGGTNDIVKRDRSEWVTVLKATRSHWEAAYLGVPTDLLDEDAVPARRLAELAS